MNITLQKRGAYKSHDELLTLVHLTKNQLIIGVLKETNKFEYSENTKDSFVSWEDLYEDFKYDYIEQSNSSDIQIADEARKARSGQVCGKLINRFVRNIPNTNSETVFKYLGKLIFDTNFSYSSVEYTDHSIIEFYAQRTGEPQAVVSRFVNSLSSKIKHSSRIRASYAQFNSLAFLGVPFKKDNLLEVGCLQVVHGKYNPISNVTLKSEPDAGGGEEASNMYQVFPSENNINVGAGETVEINYDVKWVHDKNSIGYVYNVESQENVLNETAEFKLETSAGYLPKTKTIMNNEGKGSFKFTALGLEAGDKAKVKFNLKSYTGLGDIYITVI
jgi:hypothetical protein